MMDDIPYDLLIRYSRKQATQDEIMQVEQWLSDDGHLSLYLDLKKEWTYIDDLSTVTPDKNRVWQKIQANTGKQRPKEGTRQLLLFKSVAAASVALAIISIAFYMLRMQRDQIQPLQYTTISTRANEKSKVELADGTVVWLNLKSHIIFDNQYNIEQREVTADGELFFDVKPSNRKFVVHAGGIKIEVLGTSFNIKTSGVDGHIDISLVKGKIVVRSKKDNERLFTMDSLQHATINKSDLSHTLLPSNTSNCNAWTRESLPMYNEPLGNIINKLESWYGVTIDITGLDLDKRYTFDLQNETVNDFLELFATITPIEYDIEGKKISIRSKVPTSQ